MPITEFCDQNHLTPRQRLELFVAGLPGGPARPPEGHHPPRPQAVQRPGRRCTTTQPVVEGDRLRRGQGAGPGADRQDAVHRLRADDRHAAVHVARAGGDERPGRRHAQRHLLARRAAVRTADRHDAVHRRAVQEGGATTRSAASSARRSRPGRAPGCRNSTSGDDPAGAAVLESRAVRARTRSRRS